MVRRAGRGPYCRDRPVPGARARPDPACRDHARRPAVRRGRGTGGVRRAVPALAHARRPREGAELRPRQRAERRPHGAAPARPAAGRRLGSPGGIRRGGRARLRRAPPGHNRHPRPARPAAGGPDPAVLPGPERGRDRQVNGDQPRHGQVDDISSARRARADPRGGRAVNTLENRVREAARAVAETVPASTVPPLRVAGTSACGWPASRRWGRWLAPVAAAAAVIVVAALLVAVRGGFGPGAGASPPASGGVTTGPDGVPPYYVSSNATAFFAPSNAVVKDTTTGATLGMIKPSVPGDTISAVTAAADDRTFVLAEDKWVGMNSTSFQYYETRSFYLLRLNSDGRPASVTRLPMTAGPLVTGIALSPDGTRLAIAVHPAPATGPTAAAQQTQLRVYTLASGAVRTWYANGTIGSPPTDPR